MRGKKDVVPVNELLRARVAELGEGGQRRLANQIGVTEATISRWVNGQLVPKERKWAPAIAGAVGASEDNVLASIALARKMRQEARAIAQQRAVESDEVRELRETIEELTKRLRDVERRLGDAERRRRGSDGDRGGGRSSR